MVHDYNAHMMGVNRMDQMMSSYSFERKLIKWWRKVFFWMLEVLINNAHVLYKLHTSTTQKLTMKEFRRELAVQLCQDVVRAEPHPIRRHDQTLESLCGRHFAEKSKKRRDCRVCSNKNRGGQRRLVNTFCAICSDKPFLCIGECYKVYHTRLTL